MKTQFKTFLGIFDVTPREELYLEIEDLENRVEFLEGTLEKNKEYYNDLFAKHSKNEALLKNTEAKLNEALAENSRLTEEVNRLSQRLADLPTRGARGRFVPKDRERSRNKNNNNKEGKETNK